MKHTAIKIIRNLKRLGDPEIARGAYRFVKTGKGEYGEGQRFLGIRTPILRQQIKLCKDLSITETETLLHSPFSEARQLALFLLVDKYNKGSNSEKKVIYKLYLKNTQYINNWGLVDSSAHRIVGSYLEDGDHKVLIKLARSKSLWERRIAVMSTFHFIRQYKFSTALEIIKILLNDTEDLIHKATGWMLREIGNRERAVEENFLLKYYKTMPRTTLRYAIEKFSKKTRRQYLSGEVIR